MDTKAVVLVGVILFILVFSCGCGGIDEHEHAYKYSGAKSEILLSKIPEEEFNNKSIKSLLIERLKNEFYNVTTFWEDIFIWYNEEKYVAYNDLDYNQAKNWQYTMIDFMVNSSILIESGVDRSYDYVGDFYDTESEAEQHSQHLFAEDKIFIQTQTNQIIKDIIDLYNTRVKYEEYIPIIEYD